MKALTRVLALLLLASSALAFHLFSRIDDTVHVSTPAPVREVDMAVPSTSSTTTTSTTSTTVATAKRAFTYPTDALLDRLAHCETGGTMDPATNTGNGFYGAFQFLPGTWWSVGGEGYPSDHPYEVQRDLARTLILQAGWTQFPRCSRTIGAVHG